MPIDRWRDTEYGVHIYNGIILSHKRNEIMLLITATWIDSEIIILTEDRERQISYDINDMWNLKNVIQMNLYLKQKEAHWHQKQTYGYQRGGGIN